MTGVLRTYSHYSILLLWATRLVVANLQQCNAPAYWKTRLDQGILPIFGRRAQHHFFFVLSCNVSIDWMSFTQNISSTCTLVLVTLIYLGRLGRSPKNCQVRTCLLFKLPLNPGAAWSLWCGVPASEWSAGRELERWQWHPMTYENNMHVSLFTWWYVFSKIVGHSTLALALSWWKKTSSTVRTSVRRGDWGARYSTCCTNSTTGPRHLS